MFFTVACLFKAQIVFQWEIDSNKLTSITQAFELTYLFPGLRCRDKGIKTHLRSWKCACFYSIWKLQLKMGPLGELLDVSNNMFKCRVQKSFLFSFFLPTNCALDQENYKLLLQRRGPFKHVWESLSMRHQSHPHVWSWQLHCSLNHCSLVMAARYRVLWAMMSIILMLFDTRVAIVNHAC